MTSEIESEASLGRSAAQPAWLEWLRAQGDMGKRVASFDWAATSLGPITAWPVNARAAVMICVGSLFPITLRLGSDLVLIYNDASREVYGEDRYAQALGRTSDEVWPEAANQTGHLAVGVATTGQPFFTSDGVVYLNREVPGQECYFTFAFSAIVEDDGTTSGVLSTFVETTRRVLAERRFRTLERLGHEITAAQADSELAALAMQIVSENPSDHPAGTLYRAPRPGQQAAVALATFGEPLEGPQVDELVRASLADGVPRHDLGEGHSARRLHAYPVLQPDGEAPTHVLLLRHHKSRPWDSELDGYFALVTASLRNVLLTQAELWAQRRQVAKATALDAAKSAFFAGVSHELTTPLALISAPLADILDRDEQLSARTRHDLVLANASVDRLSRMVEAMLDFSRMEAGRVVPRLQETDIALAARGLCAAFAPTLERAGLQFAVDAAPLPRPALVDRDFLERILLNLLSNAVKFTAVGTVGVRLADDGDAYLVEVSDTGPGIAPEDHDRVFARFERLSPPSGGRAAAGAGIGLAMVRQLTELLGGTVELQSALGEGSRFTVRLPYRPPVADVEGQSITPRRAESFLAEFETWPAQRERRTESEQPRLVVVEDDAHLSRFLSDSLSDAYQVESAGDGEAGLAAIRARRPDVVLTDLSMPGMDGLQLVRAIREDPALRDLPVILLSARSGDHEAALGLGRGADDYIAKPFTMVDLRARIAANLERARERTTDAAWRRAVIAAIHDGLLIFDSDGLVLEMNQSVCDLLGYTMADGPFRPPYPWWPTEEEDAEARAEIVAAHDRARRGEHQTGEFRFFRRDRQPLWVRVTDAPVTQRESGLSANVRTIRDITRERAARERRAAAAQVSADLATIDDLETLLAVAEHGLAVLFEGGTTVQLRTDRGREVLLSEGVAVTAQDLPEPVRTGLGGTTNPDARSLRPGILLVPRSSASGLRAWVQFPRPRRIGPDEMIVADLLAQAFALAVDRVIAAQRAADREANLQVAMESHRLIGQAIGILVERHRLLPAQAFDRLRATSQNRNLKLREVARRVIETGAEPEDV